MSTGNPPAALQQSVADPEAPTDLGIDDVNPVTTYRPLVP